MNKKFSVIPGRVDQRGLFYVVDDQTSRLRASLCGLRGPDGARVTFDIAYFTTLWSDPAKWNVIVPINNFLQTLTDQKYQTIIELYSQLYGVMEAIDSRMTMMHLVNTLSRLIENTLGEAWFIDDLSQFVLMNDQLAIPNFSRKIVNIVMVTEASFSDHDYLELQMVVLISKLLFPIFGEFIAKLSATSGVEVSGFEKGALAAKLIDPLLTKHFHDIINKMRKFIWNITDTEFRHTISPNANRLFGCEFEVTHLSYDKLVRILISGFVRYDLYKPDDNLVRSISSVTKRSIAFEASNSPYSKM